MPNLKVVIEVVVVGRAVLCRTLSSPVPAAVAIRQECYLSVITTATIAMRVAPAACAPTTAAIVVVIAAAVVVPRWVVAADGGWRDLRAAASPEQHHH